MLHLYGYDYAIKNVYLTASGTVGERPVDSFDQLRNYYLDALERLAPDLPINRSKSKFVTEPVIEEQLAGFFSASVLDDLKQDQVIGPAYPAAARQSKQERVALAWKTLAGRSVEFARILDLLVHSVFIRSAAGIGTRTPRAGTTSGAPGVIWLAVHDHESTEDLVEILIHELTHLLMFADELVHPQFDYAQITRRENFSASAILRDARPLDKVVHSMVVGTEIVLGRSALRPLSHAGTGAHVDSRRIAAGVTSAYRELAGRCSAGRGMTSHTREIIDLCDRQCRAYSPEQAAP